MVSGNAYTVDEITTTNTVDVWKKKVTREKRAISLEYEAQLLHSERLREDEVSHLSSNMSKMRDGHTRTTLQLQEVQ